METQPTIKVKLAVGYKIPTHLCLSWIQLLKMHKICLKYETIYLLLNTLKV